MDDRRCDEFGLRLASVERKVQSLCTAVYAVLLLSVASVGLLVYLVFGWRQLLTLLVFLLVSLPIAWVAGRQARRRAVRIRRA